LNACMKVMNGPLRLRKMKSEDRAR
jgi:hypothetical protein